MATAIDPAPLVARAITGDRGAVAKLISLVEAGGPAAVEASALLYPETGGSYTRRTDRCAGGGEVEPDRTH